MSASLPGTYVLPDPPSPEELDPSTQPGPPEHEKKIEKLKALGFPEKAITAFVVILTEQGMWAANSNLCKEDGDAVGTLPPIEAMELQRQATLQEMVHGAVVVGSDAGRFLAAETAAAMIQIRAQEAARQAQAQAQAERLMPRMENLDLRNLRQRH